MKIELIAILGYPRTRERLQLTSADDTAEAADEFLSGWIASEDGRSRYPICDIRRALDVGAIVVALDYSIAVDCVLRQFSGSLRAARRARGHLCLAF
jgi:uncharacterized protein YbaR (Trm112 family)